MATSEMTIDQLAAAVGMTVRNVRAYASRGLLPAPRLVGRTGWYDAEHVARLRLIRDLLGRGYTLAAVEKALLQTPELPDTHALDLIGLLANPLGGPSEPELISRETLATLAGVENDAVARDRLVGYMLEHGLAEPVDHQTLRLLAPELVRAGANAVAIGMSVETVFELFSEITEHTQRLADSFVSAARVAVWQPFAERGMPEAEWQVVTDSFEAIIPVAVQSVLAGFRQALSASINTAMGEELGNLTGEVPVAEDAALNTNG